MSSVKVTAALPDGKQLGEWETDELGRHTMLPPDDPRVTDPYGHEAQLLWARAGLKSASGNPRADRLGRQLAAALETLDATEVALSRVLRRWDKARARVRRLHREIDKIEAAEREATPAVPS